MKPVCLARNRRFLQFHAAPGGFRRAGIDRRDLMAMRHQFEQRRHRKIGRAHEDETEGHRDTPICKLREISQPRAWRTS